jgi:predicted amidohydrolase
MPFLHRLVPSFIALVTAGAFGLFAADEIRAPGNRPLEASVHALVGGRVVISPGRELEKATIVIRDGRIVAVGAEVPVPAEAQVHDMTGDTIYAGFIDAHVSFSKAAGRNTDGAVEGPPIHESIDLTSGAGSGFLGTTVATGGSGAKSVVTPERRIAREYSPDKKALDALRTEGFTSANVVPTRA